MFAVFLGIRRLGAGKPGGDPGLATDPRIAWMIAGCYFATRTRIGLTAFERADRGDVEQLARVLNGGLAGLDARRHLTATALEAMA